MTAVAESTPSRSAPPDHVTPGPGPLAPGAVYGACDVGLS